MSERKRNRTPGKRTQAASAKPPVPPRPLPAAAAPVATPAAKVAAPAAVPVATLAAVPVAAPAVVPVPPGALAGSALRTLQAQLTCTAELSAGWYKLMLAASHSASQLWLGKVQG